jgi:hypothetical protein
MTVNCAGCKKPFSFDTAGTPKEQVYHYSESGKGHVNYYPTCPHCGKRNVVSAPKG